MDPDKIVESPTHPYKDKPIVQEMPKPKGPEKQKGLIPGEDQKSGRPEVELPQKVEDEGKGEGKSFGVPKGDF